MGVFSQSNNARLVFDSADDEEDPSLDFSQLPASIPDPVYTYPQPNIYNTGYGNCIDNAFVGQMLGNPGGHQGIPQWHGDQVERTPNPPLPSFYTHSPDYNFNLVDLPMAESTTFFPNPGPNVPSIPNGGIQVTESPSTDYVAQSILDDIIAAAPQQQPQQLDSGRYQQVQSLPMTPLPDFASGPPPQSHKFSHARNTKLYICRDSSNVECDKTFTNRRVLDEHMLDVHGVKAYKCPMPGCNNEISRYDNIKAHTEKCRHNPNAVAIKESKSPESISMSQPSKRRLCMKDLEPNGSLQIKKPKPAAASSPPPILYRSKVMETKSPPSTLRRRRKRSLSHSPTEINPQSFTESSDDSIAIDTHMSGLSRSQPGVGDKIQSLEAKLDRLQTELEALRRESGKNRSCEYQRKGKRPK
ncbi:hypothetical protein TWF481_004924 [Arthrobotrys musiformis]|uniref:C2H2-type domain-containing protein n=1 Tax=Arthrobotrys musiformis TaxID=47236 RepID=A0AAV9WRP1_9PEZI